MIRTAFILFLLVASLSFSAVAQTGTTYYVRTTGSDAANGISWNTAFQTLQKALSVVQSGDQIWVATGTYYPDEGPGQSDNDRNSAFSMKNGVRILGGFPASNDPVLADRNPTSFTTVLSGDLDKNSTLDDGNAYHIIMNQPGLTNSAVLDGFVIMGGNASDKNRFPNYIGGGVYNDGGSGVKFCNPSFRNCLFQANSAAFYGGAMYNNGYNRSESSPELINCSFLANSASYGGAMNNYGDGGESSPQLTNCLFKNNTASYGGAMYNTGSSGESNPHLTNCLFQANQGTKGGAIYNNGLAGQSSPQLINCSFQANSASYGGAMYNNNYYSQSSPQLTNCIVFGNGGSNTFYNDNSPLPSATYSLFEGGVTGVDVSGSGNIFTNATPFASTTSVTLNPNTCAINGGDPASTTITAGTTDLAGQDRFFLNGRIDMGAFEYLGSPAPRQAVTYPASPDNALTFDGTNDFVSIAFQDNLNCSTMNPGFTNALTIEYWFKGNNLQSAVRFQNGSNYVSAGYGSPGAHKHIMSNDGGVSDGLAVGVAATDGNWHHIAFSWQQGGQFTSYLDGQVVASRAAGNTPLPSISNFYLGSFNGISEFMNGTLDELRIWNMARTQQQIQQNMLPCNFTLPQTGLVMYFSFDHGTPNGDNSGQTLLLNRNNPDQYPGTLQNFNLTGNTSNWTDPTDVLSLLVSSTTVCQGQTFSLTATGCTAGTVTWLTGTRGRTLTLTAGSSASVLTATCTVGSCSTTASGSVVVVGQQPPASSLISLRTDESACPALLLGQGVGTSFVFTGPGGYVFSNAYQNGGTYEVLGLEVKQPGVYTLTATYTNACGSSLPVARTVTVNRQCP